MKPVKQVMPFRRKREGKTDYKKRLTLLKSGKPRVVIRKTLRYLTIQLVEYRPEGDRVVLTVSSQHLPKLGWKYSCGNVPAAYLTGLLFGKKAQEKKASQVIADLGGRPSVKGSRLYAAIKGIQDAGLKVGYSDEMLPDQNRIHGQHITNWAEQAKQPQFAQHQKRKVQLKELANNFKQVKAKITGS